MAVAGEAAMLKSAFADTVMVVVAVWVLVPSVALTVMVLLPVASAPAETVSVVELPGVTVDGEKLQPLAGCVQLKLTVALSPFTAAVATVIVAFVPAVMVELAGVRVMVKLGTAAVTVTEALAVWVFVPSVALMLMETVPTGRALAAIVRVLEPPGVTVAGVKLHPLAGAVHDSVTEALSLLMAVVLIVKVADDPETTL